jgi:hypothetical protein
MSDFKVFGGRLVSVMVTEESISSASFCVREEYWGSELGVSGMLLWRKVGGIRRGRRVRGRVRVPLDG